MSNHHPAIFRGLHNQIWWHKQRRRWNIEDSFKVAKECLDRKEVQVLDLRGIRTRVALAWVAADFLYQLGVTLE